MICGPDGIFCYRVLCIYQKQLFNYLKMALIKVIELLAESEKGWEDAANNAVKEASKSVRNIKSIYIKNMNAEVANGKITHYRLNCKISFEKE